MSEAIIWLATFLNLAACALNMWPYIRGKRLNKEVEDALDKHKRAAMPEAHIVQLIHEQPAKEVKTDAP